MDREEIWPDSASLQAGLPFETAALTVDRQCGSGLEAVNLAMRLVQSGAGDIFLAGGVESTSLAPWKIAKPTSLYAPQGPAIFTRARFSPDFIGDPDMGIAAENVAASFWDFKRGSGSILLVQSPKKRFILKKQDGLTTK